MKGLRRSMSAAWGRFRNPPVGYQHGRRSKMIGRFPVVHWLYYWLTAHLTPRLLLTGVFAVAPTAFLMLSGWNNQAFSVTFAVLGWIVACMVLGWAGRPQLCVEPRLPVRVERGSAFETLYEVRNVGKKMARSVSIDTVIFSGVSHLRLKSAYLGALEPGGAAAVRGSGVARVRGVYTLPTLRWDTDYPCCFWRWGRTGGVERILSVYPNYTRLTSFELPLGNRNRNELSAANELSRDAFEFHGCREFRDGDSLRHVHPRSSARVGEPVVKEFQTEGRSRTALLVDTQGRLMAGGVREHLLKSDPAEAALSLAAAIVDALSVTERVLELLVAGPEVYRFVSAGRVGYLEEVLDILAAVEPSRDDPLERLKPLLFDEIRLIQSVCLVLTGWDKRREELVRDVQAAGVGIKTILVTANGRRPEGVPEEVAVVSAREVLRGEVAEI